MREYLASEAPMRLAEYRNKVVQVAPSGLVVEYDAVGTLAATGDQYSMRHVLFAEANEGKITVWRDCWNPLDAATVFGKRPDS